jgi:hypothetical protein
MTRRLLGHAAGCTDAGDSQVSGRLRPVPVVPAGRRRPAHCPARARHPCPFRRPALCAFSGPRWICQPHDHERRWMERQRREPSGRLTQSRLEKLIADDLAPPHQPLFRASSGLAPQPPAALGVSVVRVGGHSRTCSVPGPDRRSPRGRDHSSPVRAGPPTPRGLTRPPHRSRRRCRRGAHPYRLSGLHPSGVDVSSSGLRFLTQQLRRHRRAICSRWRRLTVGRQALHPRPSADGTPLCPARRRIRRRHHDGLPLHHRIGRAAGHSRPQPGRCGASA